MFDACENPDLSLFEALVVGTGIYSGKMDRSLEAYLARNATMLSRRVKALFIVCGGGDAPRGRQAPEPSFEDYDHPQRKGCLKLKEDEILAKTK